MDLNERRDNWNKGIYLYSSVSVWQTNKVRIQLSVGRWVLYEGCVEMEGSRKEGRSREGIFE